MTKSLYFKIVGYCLLVCLVIGLVLSIVGFSIGISKQIDSSTRTLLILQFVGELIIIIFFAPALGLLFLSHSEVLEKVFPSFKPGSSKPIKTNEEWYKGDVKLKYSTPLADGSPIVVPAGTIGKVIFVKGDYLTIDVDINGKQSSMKVYKGHVERIK